MDNKVKVPGGAFYAGDGLTVDQATRTVSAGGGSSVSTPDWNQNDATASDYIKNRPFYTGDPVNTVFVEESTVSFADDGGMYIGQLESTFSATVGETYKVYWDGTVYECTCVNYDGPAIGNLSIEDDYPDTGEPFVIHVSDDYIVIYTKDSSDSHTISVSGIVAPIVKIPAKYIDKNSSGYIVIHNKGTMTQQEVENYNTAILTKEVVFIIWNEMCISKISLDGTNSTDLNLTTQNGEVYNIKKNADGLFYFSDRKLNSAAFPNSISTTDRVAWVTTSGKKIVISSNNISTAVGSTNIVFQVRPDGTKSKSFDVLGNGEAVAPALILYSSTANSTKKFKITVDDSGTISATEVTE